MDYVRKTYGMPWLKRGVVVRIRGNETGVVTSASQYVNVRLNGETRSRIFHPGDVKRVQSHSACNEGGE